MNTPWYSNEYEAPRHTLRSAWLANCSMKPLTASTFVLMALLVVGMPYMAWRQAGVTVEPHEDGTARSVRFDDRLGGVENDGTPEAIAKLGSGAEDYVRICARYQIGATVYARGGGVHELKVTLEVGGDRVREGTDDV